MSNLTIETSDDTSAERVKIHAVEVSERNVSLLQFWISTRTLTVPHHQSYSAFSSLSIRGILSGPGSDAFKLDRAESFPSNRMIISDDECSTENEGWDPLPLPQDKSHLEIELKERISHGRIGITYRAQLQLILDEIGGSPMTCSSLQSPQEFCVKLVKPQFIRSLAREAWFYEQLAELQGVAVPRCFGFFVAPLPNGVSWIDAWGEFRDEDEETSNESHSKDRQEKESYCYPDLLDDDCQDLAFRADGRQSKSSSRWNNWRHSPESPLVGVLLLELGSALERRTRDYFTEQEKCVCVSTFNSISL